MTHISNPNVNHIRDSQKGKSGHKQKEKRYNDKYFQNMVIQVYTTSNTTLEE